MIVENLNMELGLLENLTTLEESIKCKRMELVSREKYLKEEFLRSCHIAAKESAIITKLEEIFLNLVSVEPHFHSMRPKYEQIIAEHRRREENFLKIQEVKEKLLFVGCNQIKDEMKDLEQQREPLLEELKKIRGEFSNFIRVERFE